MKYLKPFLTSSLLVFVLLVGLTLFLSSQHPVFADTIKDDADVGCRTSIDGYEGVLTIGCLASVLVNAVRWAYGFSLVAGMAYFIFGGITFMMAQDDKAIKTGRDKMMWAVFGFVFIVVSFLLIRTVLLLLGLPDLVNNFSFFVKS